MKFNIDNGGTCNIFCNRLGLSFYFIAVIVIAAIFFFSGSVLAFDNTKTEFSLSIDYICQDGYMDFLYGGGILPYLRIYDDGETIKADINGIFMENLGSCLENDNKNIIVIYDAQTLNIFINCVFASSTLIDFDNIENFNFEGFGEFTKRSEFYYVLDNQEIINICGDSSTFLVNDQDVGKIYEYNNAGTLTKIYEIPFFLWILIGSVILEIFLVFFIFKYYAVK